MMGNVSYPDPGSGLMHNLYPKERKKYGKKKGGVSKGGKSPKKGKK
jgi:hypothetical protein